MTDRDRPRDDDERPPPWAGAPGYTPFPEGLPPHAPMPGAPPYPPREPPPAPVGRAERRGTRPAVWAAAILVVLVLLALLLT